MKTILFVLALSASSAALSAAIDKCPDGTYREVPCPGTQQSAVTSTYVPRTPSNASRTQYASACNPEHPDYIRCRRELNALEAQELSLEVKRDVVNSMRRAR
jgi:hypothetical protein